MPDNSNGSVRIEFTPEFKRNLRFLVKKYHHIRSDVEPVINQLLKGEVVGDQVPKAPHPVFKVRIINSDIGKGKRSGYRLIYYLKTPKWIILITIYSKLDQSDITADKIRRILSEFDV